MQGAPANRNAPKGIRREPLPTGTKSNSLVVGWCNKGVMAVSSPNAPCTTIGGRLEFSGGRAAFNKGLMSASSPSLLSKSPLV
eukprot:8536350-Pyramimonas_sp.AAC.2